MATSSGASDGHVSGGRGSSIKSSTHASSRWRSAMPFAAPTGGAAPF